MTVVVERATGAPDLDLAALIEESERDGVAFVRRLAGEWASGANRFDGPGEALFLARLGAEVAGVCGLNVDPYQRRPDVGRLRHLYVGAAFRRRGVGRALVAEVVNAARGRFVRLRLSTTSPAAARLYEGLGFRRRPGAGRCTHVLELR